MPEARWIKFKKQELHNRLKDLLAIDRGKIRRGNFQPCRKEKSGRDAS